MLTKSQALALHSGQIIHHVSLKNSDRTPLRVRVNGQVKTWKTRPSEFSVPIKHGLYAYGYITHANASEWEVAE